MDCFLLGHPDDTIAKERSKISFKLITKISHLCCTHRLILLFDPFKYGELTNDISNDRLSPRSYSHAISDSTRLTFDSSVQKMLDTCLPSEHNPKSKDISRHGMNHPNSKDISIHGMNHPANRERTDIDVDNCSKGWVKQCVLTLR